MNVEITTVLATSNWRELTILTAAGPLVVHHAVLGKIGIFHFELSLLFPRKFARNSYKFSFR